MKDQKRYDLARMVMESHYLDSLEKSSCAAGSFSEMERQMYLDIINDFRELALKQQEELASIQEKLDSFAQENAHLRAELDKVSKEKSDVSESNELHKQTLYGSKSQKGTKSSGKRAKGRDEEKDDFDGTSGSLPDQIPGSEETSASDSPLKESAVTRKAIRPAFYDKMDAAREVIYECDLTDLPKDKRFLYMKDVEEYERVAYIQKNVYRVAVLEDEFGNRSDYFVPQDKSVLHRPYQNVLKGTHATPELLGDLVTNRFQLQQPVYRELIRMGNEKMSICRQTIGNWFRKGAEILKELLPYLKAQLLENLSFIHSDETWCRVRIELSHAAEKFGYAKRYIWVLVNEAAKVVYYLYDNGSRAGRVIRDFLGDFKGSMQTDGYVVYRFFNNEEVGIEHIVCMAHVRAKFKSAQTTGKDSRADYFLDRIGALYGIESENHLSHRSPEEVLEIRKTKSMEILGDIQQRARLLEDDPNAHCGKLLKTALSYMMNHWQQLIKYTRDARYTIDNSVVERSIRPFTIGRKNSISFGSEDGAEVASVYYTFVETCKLRGISPKDYFVDFFRWIVSGRTDYEAMLPALAVK